MSVADIARAWDLARQSVQRLADALVGDGLLSYEENPHHRRAKLAALTPLGRQVLDECRARRALLGGCSEGLMVRRRSDG